MLLVVAEKGMIEICSPSCVYYDEIAIYIIYLCALDSQEAKKTPKVGQMTYVTQMLLVDTVSNFSPNFNQSERSLVETAGYYFLSTFALFNCVSG